MYNEKDIDRLVAELAQAQAEDGERYEKLLEKYTGPATGLMYDDETYELTIASTFAPDEDGNIVNILDNTGPAMGKVLRNGRIVRV